mmetsp:Transcript_16827/g.35595  ORF Transcript_16827/g.35595 Transcript_16827/m.35595 type:complete len:391 (+) Transcript_16827:106-1278(+)
MMNTNHELLKPPRPCTEYNLFFQLERSYILQVLLSTQPNIKPEEAFDPSQDSYKGLPPLPDRYASLVLPYDWHLPGKERRRKRKHRKSHGAIGFHELSNMISSAWKNADAEVKHYCSQVSKVGLATYKVQLKEWKKKCNKNQKPQAQDRAQKKPSKDLWEKVLQMECHASSSPQPNMIQAGNNGGSLIISSESPIPSPAVNTKAMNQAFEQAIKSDDTLVAMEDVWAHDVTNIYNPVRNDSIKVPLCSKETDSMHHDYSLDEMKNGGINVVRNDSIISHVDVGDEEIMRMWNKTDDDSNHQCCYDWFTQLWNKTDDFNCSPQLSPMTQNKTHEEKTVQYHSLFGTKGYKETMKDIRHMERLLEQQGQRLQELQTLPRVKRRRSTLVAWSA